MFYSKSNNGTGGSACISYKTPVMNPCKKIIFSLYILQLEGSPFCLCNPKMGGFSSELTHNISENLKALIT